MITLTIDGQPVQVPSRTTILEAARLVNIDIPRLCHLENLLPYGGCGICVVQVEGERTFTRACVREAQGGMNVQTNTPALRQTRRMLVELLLADHPAECFICSRSSNCELKALAAKLGVEHIRFDQQLKHRPLDESSVSIVRNPDKCILCGRCVRVCNEVQTVGALEFAHRGASLSVGTALDRNLADVECVNCGQCIHVCPVAAITEKSCIEQVWQALADPDKHVLVQEAPAVRAALGEELGLPPGTLVTGKMHAALKRLGFDSVFDTNFSADLTIMEEGNELVKRIQETGPLPLLTSCCPGWVRFAENFYPDLLHHLSTCKSPQQMFGALAKTYFARKAGLDSDRIVSVSIMPCTAKKFEAQRPEMCSSGYRDVDYVITTRELARMIRQAGIDFTALPEQPADELMGRYTGAATIFGVTGGVMEAALRTAYRLVTKQELDQIEIQPVRGMTGVRTASVTLVPPSENGEGLTVKVAVAHGLGNARALLDEIRAGKSTYHLIEIMACPGGCVGGGGQPIGFDIALRGLRGETLYQEDRSLTCRRSHENSAVQQLYHDYLGSPLGEKSHHLLHTGYSPVSREGSLPASRREIEMKGATNR